MKITVLGCGASLGTPAAGGFWGRCDPAEPRNRRTRASLLVQSAKSCLIIDATPDLRIHLNTHLVQNIDGLLLTHAHSDHINGIDDLRAIAFHNNKLIETYTNSQTLESLMKSAAYIFSGGQDIYTPFIKPNVIDSYSRFSVGDIAVSSFPQDHLVCESLGFRFGDFAYSVDMADLEQRALDALKGVEVWIVDAGSYQKETPRTHANIQRVLQWVDILKPKITYLTVLTSHMDYKTLCDELPPHIRPAHDGLEIDMAGNLR